jgi:hypothetical protein
MKSINNFAGLNGFVWWMGVVEGRKDPLKIGRCQVRIFGWHTENKQLIPTEDLPWSMPLYPVNKSKDFSTPVEGDYVVGFFLDSESGQAPVMMGVLPGIQTTSPAGDAGFQDARSSDEIASAPKVPSNQIIHSLGQPTVVPLARGIVDNSAISATNSARDAVKSVVGPIKSAIASAKAEVLIFVQEIRAAKDAIIASLIPPGAGIVNNLLVVPLQIADQVKAYAQQASAIADAAAAAKSELDELNATIDYAKSLPAEELAQINSEVNLSGQTGGLLNTVTSDAKTQITSLTNSITV